MIKGAIYCVWYLKSLFKDINYSNVNKGFFFTKCIFCFSNYDLLDQPSKWYLTFKHDLHFTIKNNWLIKLKINSYPFRDRAVMKSSLHWTKIWCKYEMAHPVTPLFIFFLCVPFFIIFYWPRQCDLHHHLDQIIMHSLASCKYCVRGKFRTVYICADRDGGNQAYM